jgi:hypothetical protein
MLDLVPFTGARRIMTDRDRKRQAVGQVLQMDLLRAQPVAVAPASIGTNQQALRLWIGSASQEAPPTSDTCDGEFGGLIRKTRRDSCRHLNSSVQPGLALAP